MKKLLTMMTLALSFLLVFGLAGCGKKELQEEITINDLYQQGFYPTISSFSGEDTLWKAYYTKDGDWTKTYYVEIPMTEDQNNELYEIVSDEAYQELICAKENITITDASDKVPAADVYEKYVGKSLADLQADGYDYCGATEGQDGYVIGQFSKPGEYVFDFELNEPTTFDEFCADDVDFSALTVKTITFAGFEWE